MTPYTDSRSVVLGASGERWARPLTALALLGLTMLAYTPGLTGGFVFDDHPNLLDNTALHVVTLDWRDWMAATFSSPATSLQRPLAMLTFAAEYLLVLPCR